jgi:hypothetical protein
VGISITALWIGASAVIYWLCASTGSPLLRLYVWLWVKSHMRLWNAQYRHKLAYQEEEDENA